MTQKPTGSNDALVMNMIRRQGPIARSDIAKATGLTAPTVTNISGKLLELGLIIEDRIGESSGGRRPILLKVCEELPPVLVMHIGSESMRAYLVDAFLAVAYEEHRSIKGLKKEEVLELLLQFIEQCCRVSSRPVQGIGIVLRGPVRGPEGISVFSPNVGWKNVPLKAIVEEKFKLPTFIENDAKAATNGVYHFGALRSAGSLLFLKVSHGIGAGIMFNGQIYRGINDGAGEVGHMTIDIGGPLCSCGNYGCWESLASESALVEMIIKAIKEGQPSKVSELVGGDLSRVTADTVYEAVNSGDYLALYHLRRVARYLGIGIANLVNIFNPELVVIGGGLAQTRPHIEEIIRQTVSDRSFESCSSTLEIAFSHNLRQHTVQGTADLVFAGITEKVWLASK